MTSNIQRIFRVTKKNFGWAAVEEPGPVTGNMALHLQATMFTASCRPNILRRHTICRHDYHHLPQFAFLSAQCVSGAILQPSNMASSVRSVRRTPPEQQFRCHHSSPFAFRIFRTNFPSDSSRCSCSTEETSESFKTASPYCRNINTSLQQKLQDSFYSVCAGECLLLPYGWEDPCSQYAAFMGGRTRGLSVRCLYGWEDPCSQYAACQ
jgi:hypothetical protein